MATLFIDELPDKPFYDSLSLLELANRIALSRHASPFERYLGERLRAASRALHETDNLEDLIADQGDEIEEANRRAARYADEADGLKAQIEELETEIELLKAEKAELAEDLKTYTTPRILKGEA